MFTRSHYLLSSFSCLRGGHGDSAGRWWRGTGGRPLLTHGLDESSHPGADQPALLSCSASLSISQIQPWAKEQVTNPGTVLPPESPAAQRGKQPVTAGVGVSLRILSGAERSPLDPSCSLRINICTYHHVLFWKPQQPCQARLAMLNCKALWVESPCLSQLMFTAYLRAREYGCARECAWTCHCHFPLRICVGVRVKLPATGGEMPKPVEERIP